MNAIDTGRQTWPKNLTSMTDYVRKPERIVIGLLPGTSADGVSTVLARISGSGIDTRAEVVAGSAASAS